MNKQEALEVLKRNRQLVTVPNIDVEAPPEQQFQSILPDFQAIEQELKEEKRVADHTLAEIWPMITETYRDILADIMSGQLGKVLSTQKRLFSLAILIALIYVGVLVLL